MEFRVKVGIPWQDFADPALPWPHSVSPNCLIAIFPNNVIFCNQNAVPGKSFRRDDSIKRVASPMQFTGAADNVGKWPVIDIQTDFLIQTGHNFVRPLGNTTNFIEILKLETYHLRYQKLPVLDQLNRRWR